MTKRLVLVSLDWIRPKDPRMGLGHASLWAALNLAGVSVVSICKSVNDPTLCIEELIDVVYSASGGDDIAIGVYVWNESLVQRLLSGLRARGFRGRIILGGPQISYALRGLGQTYPEADVFVRGYGEDALVSVVCAEGREEALGITYVGEAERDGTAVVDLGRLPSPILTGVIPVQRFMRWETQRGCVFTCNFCQHREAGSRLRHRELDRGRIADEIDAMVAGGARDIAVLDPIFNSNPSAVGILRRFAARGYTGRLSVQARFEQIDDGFLNACADLNMRLEFGLQTIHKSEMLAVRRINKLELAERVTRDLQARGLRFEVSLIYGLPEQTLSSFEESVRWCIDRGAIVRAFPLMLLRGTGLDLERHRWGLIESDDPIPVVVASRTFTVHDHERMREIAVSLERQISEEAA